MRYFAPGTARVLVLHHAQRRFFFQGPIYLLRLGLRREAAALAAAMWAVGAATLTMTRLLVWPVLEGARGPLALLETMAVAYRTGDSANAALAELMVLLMPWVSGIFAAMLIVGLTTIYLPDLMDRTLSRQGFRRLVEEDVDHAQVHAA